MPQDVTAVPSPATETEAPPVMPPMETWTDEQHHEWRMTGKTPEAPPSPEATAPPKPESQASATEEVKTEAAPDTAIQQEPKQTRRKIDAETRIQQLIRENADLQRRLETTAAPRTAAPAPEPVKETRLVKPKLDDFTGEKAWEEYDAATEKYYLDKAAEIAQAAVAKDRQERETAAQRAANEERNQQIETGWNKRVKEFTTNHPEAKDFKATVAALVDSGLIPEGSFLDQWILHSESGPALAWHFSQTTDDITRIGELHPILAARELAKLENSFESKTVPVSQKTQAALPKPPNEVGGRNASTGDEVADAVRQGNVREYIDKQNARELAASRK